MENRCDIHVHTVFSYHAYSTVEEDVRAAAEAGLELVGIADHYSTMVCPGLEPTMQSLAHFNNVVCWPRRWHGVELLAGAEADIVDLDGHLLGHDIVQDENLVGDALARPTTLQARCFEQLDYVIASVHTRDFCRGASRIELTAMYLAALEHPRVLMLGHIGRTGLDVDYRALARRARELGKLIEVNEHSLAGGWGAVAGERCRKVVRACAEEGCMVAVDTDAHISWAVGRTDHARGLLAQEHFPEELVATASAERLLSVLEAAVSPLRPRG